MERRDWFLLFDYFIELILFLFSNIIIIKGLVSAMFVIGELHYFYLITCITLLPIRYIFIIYNLLLINNQYFGID